jgi:hypothetical protein
VWSLDNDQLTEIARIPAQDIQVAALALNSDGNLLGMVDSGGVVHLISLPDGNELSSADTTYTAFQGARLTFSADDRRLLAHIMDVAANSVPLDGIYLWDVEALRSGATDTAPLIPAMSGRNLCSTTINRSWPFMPGWILLFCWIPKQGRNADVSAAAQRHVTSLLDLMTAMWWRLTLAMGHSGFGTLNRRSTMVSGG